MPATTAAFSIVISANTDGTASAAHRAAQFVSPSTKNLYISLQDSAGHGNATYSYAEAINSSTCTPGSTAGTQVCTFNISLPIGSDTVSVLATDGSNIPLSYASASATVNADGTIGYATPGGVDLGGIVASAKMAYAFSPFNGGANEPIVTVALADAANDPLSLGSAGPGGPPLGEIVGSFVISQTVGQFVPQSTAIHDGPPTTLGPATNTFTAAGFYKYAIAFDEIGNGTTTPFSTKITVTTPQVQYTNVEFPKLPVSAATVPATSASLTLSCQFASSTPAVDPCPSAVAVPIHVF